MPLYRGKTRSLVRQIVLTSFATLGVYYWPVWNALEERREYSRWQEQVPFESLETRLPTNWQTNAAEPSAKSNRLLDRVEDELEKNYKAVVRIRAIQLIHERQIGVFVDNPSFGVGRMITRPKQSVIQSLPELSQPGVSIESLRSIDAKQSDTGLDPELSVEDLHQTSIVNFVNKIGFGYFKNRGEVAGFQSHGFRSVPEPVKPLTLRSVELVGLRKQEPVVYVSELLPLMSELANAPTRPLDDFEKAGLNKLTNGDDLFTEQQGPDLRVLGAIRATKQCVECHACNRGDLLGAFSYSLGVSVNPMR